MSTQDGDPDDDKPEVPKHDVRGAQGAQVGDHNVMHNHYGAADGTARNGPDRGGDIYIDLGPEGEFIDIALGTKAILDVGLKNLTRQRRRFQLHVDKPTLRLTYEPHPANLGSDEGQLSAEGVVTLDPGGKLRMRLGLESSGTEPAAGIDALHVSAMAVGDVSNIIGWNRARRIRVARNRSICFGAADHKILGAEPSVEVHQLAVSVKNTGNTRELVRVIAESAGSVYQSGRSTRPRWIDSRWVAAETPQTSLDPHDAEDVVLRLRLPARSILARTWLTQLAAESIEDKAVLGTTSKPLTLRQPGRVTDAASFLVIIGRGVKAVARLTRRALGNLHRILRRRMIVSRYAMVMPCLTVLVLAGLILLTTASASTRSGDAVAQIAGNSSTASMTSEQILGRVRQPPATVPATCTHGGWITQLASTSVDGRGLQDILDKVVALRSRTSTPLELKLMESDDACSTIASNYYVLYMGPYDSSSKAISVCNSFGWWTHDDHDRNECFGHAVDPTVKGSYVVWPDGTEGPSHP
jgi:hypothetical protein